MIRGVQKGEGEGGPPEQTQKECRAQSTTPPPLRIPLERPRSNRQKLTNQVTPTTTKTCSPLLQHEDKQRSREETADDVNEENRGMTYSPRVLLHRDTVWMILLPQTSQDETRSSKILLFLSIQSSQQAAAMERSRENRDRPSSNCLALLHLLARSPNPSKRRAHTHE